MTEVSKGPANDRLWGLTFVFMAQNFVPLQNRSKRFNNAAHLSPHQMILLNAAHLSPHQMILLNAAHLSSRQMILLNLSDDGSNGSLGNVARESLNPSLAPSSLLLLFLLRLFGTPGTVLNSLAAILILMKQSHLLLLQMA